MSGLFVSPNKVPPGAQWIMYLSPFFWGSAGALLTMFQYAELGEQPCQSFASCIVYNPSFMAYATGYPALATARESMYVLIGMILILMLIEYILLCQKVVQRDDYEILDSVEEEEIENDHIIEFHYESTRTNDKFLVQRIGSAKVLLDSNESI